MKIAWLAMFLSIMSCQTHASELSRFVTKVGGIDEPVYAVTVPFLASHGSELDGKIVSVSGYLALAKVSVLFSSKDSYETSDAANGLVIELPRSGSRLQEMIEQRNHSFVRIFGRYSSRKATLAEYGAMNAAGTISEILSVESSYSPWGFAWPSSQGTPSASGSD
jgi:hypothetical protein